ncbi:hypothetical protein H5410_027543 [Solanum commersonii]|uniref:Uncharacterized protein n=1 Tax=Solanum commersonii TaxID=4109 RepID=A0A9J5YZG6_SOLCO|nr:hypothetical protein H5410_027543 [Solanum commersonii]
MAGTPPLTQRLVHPNVSPSSTATPSATPDEMLSLVPGQKDKLGDIRQKDVARALKDCGEIPNSIRQAMFNNFKTMCTWELRHNHVLSTTFERKADARLSV